MPKPKNKNLPFKNKLERIRKEIAAFINQFFAPIVFLLVVVILVGGYFFIIRVQYANLVKSRDVDLTGLEKEITKLNQELVLFSQYVKEDVGFTDKDRELLSRALPDKFDFPSIVVQFTALAQKYDVEVLSINIKENLKDEAYWPQNPALKKVNINVGVFVENYDKWRRFIKALESSVMVFDVQSISFSSASNYSLDVAAYYYQP
ncbi:MAG TPA: hypothetical protein PK619_02095 [bacterium]|nr:hypothetical protein [bacterium]HPN81194.1 hypothetical protein [bacterium]HPW39491.1 hypothetical protein [bacterium]